MNCYGILLYRKGVKIFIKYSFNIPKHYLKIYQINLNINLWLLSVQYQASMYIYLRGIVITHQTIVWGRPVG